MFFDILANGEFFCQPVVGVVVGHRCRDQTNYYRNGENYNDLRERKKVRVVLYAGGWYVVSSAWVWFFSNSINTSTELSVFDRFVVQKT